MRRESRQRESRRRETRRRETGSPVRAAHLRRLAATAFALVLIASSCGGDGSDAQPDASGVVEEIAAERSVFCEEAGDVSTRVLRRGDVVTPSSLSDVTWEDSEGDLRVFNTIVQLRRVSWAGHLITPEGVLCPDDGYVLLALDVDARIFPWSDPQATLAVSIGGSSIDVPLGDGTGAESADYLLVTPVPADADGLELALRRDGFESRHSLLDGAPVGTKPEILYRDADRPFVATDLNVGSNLPFRARWAQTTGSDFNESSGSGQFRVTSAALSYFPPTRTDTASGTDRAYMWINTEYLDVEGRATWNVHHPLEHLPAERAQLVLPDGTELELERSDGMSSSDAYFGSVLGGDDSFFTFVWWAEVPADLTAATFRVTPGTVRYPGSSGDVTFEGTAEIDISF